MSWITRFSPRLKLGLALVFLAGFNTAAYWPSPRAPFVFDDYFNILENADVWRVGMGQASFLELARPTLQSRRTLAAITFALNLRCFGPSPFSFHLGNLILHVFNSWLLFFLLLALWGQHSDAVPNETRQTLLLPALLGSLLWSLHPVLVPAVTYIVQRVTSLAGFFYLASLLLWLRGRRMERRFVQRGILFLALLLGGIGFFAKEILITLPVVLLLLEFCFFGQGQPLRHRRVFLASSAAVLIGYALFLLLLMPLLLTEITASVPHFQVSVEERLISLPRLIWHYLSLLAFPALSRLSLDPEWTFSKNLWRPWTTTPAWLALAALLAVSRLGLRRWPLFAFAVLFFLITLLPETLLPLDPVFEHRLYVPSTVLLGVCGAAWAWPGARQRTRRSWLAVALAFLAILTFSRNQLWTNELSLWRDAVEKSPRKAHPWAGLAQANLQRNQIQTALQAYRQAAKLDPNDFLAGFNLTLLYLELGNHRQALLLAERMYHLNPENPFALLALGSVAGAAGDADHALELYSRLRKKKPAEPNMLGRLACGLLDINRPDLAEEVAEKIFQLFPGRAGNYLLLGNIRFYQGRWSEAANAYAKELELDPHSVSAINNLGMAYVKQGRLELALNWFEQAVAEDPSQAISHENLCETFYDLGRLDRAQASCLTAVRLDPSLYLGWKKLGEIYLREGRREAAVQALEQAKKLAPDDPEVKELWEQAGGG